ncbi:hypothetical protein RM530_10760 [Algiphilus sp. W345]|uniref:Uncharacterized protein n=1 Tax=Banduia mediterranea TaxID=3075609 RepID=A0ABU2WIZ6_9GAMM|nr:hypothetical protein [Algiphilus sp. W345]MDT0497837.1 hypothetical protein [Algiphilus sp. W345]
MRILVSGPERANRFWVIGRIGVYVIADYGKRASAKLIVVNIAAIDACCNRKNQQADAGAGSDVPSTDSCRRCQSRGREHVSS